jgi:GDPmannose 4,6-dehydratase
MKKAIVTGITGQDGSYLTELLLEKGYMVYGFVRRSSTPNYKNIESILDHKNLKLIYCDLTSPSAVIDNILDIEPDETYNIAAQSDVRVSFDIPEYTMQCIAVGTTGILEGLRKLKIKGNNPKFYQASTSEMFGLVQETPQRETTPFYPRSPYGCAKLAAHWMSVNYRESYGMFNCNGILFNHESPRRGTNFVTRKIIHGMKRIVLGKQDCLTMGNIDAHRDWGHAKDYVEVMHKMLQHHTPDDYVVATGELHTVREFIEISARYFDFDIVWEGRGENEVGIDRKSNRCIVKIDPYFYRPAEVQLLLGNPSKAHFNLDWLPNYTFKGLVEDMCENEKGE